MSEPEQTLKAHSRPSTMDQTGKRLWIYPQAVAGFFTHRREWVSYFLVVVYLLIPWLRYDGLPLVQLNITERQFIILGNIYWPHDVKYLVFVLILAGISLFFFTALAGRLWCGWACPQTVFLEFIFRKVETWIEGDRNKRMALDRAPWTSQKLIKKASKHAVFLLFSAIVANTFLAYFVGTENVLVWMTQAPTEHWVAFLVMAANLGVFYFNFAWFREQFCTILCPYARFQSALTDEHTLQVTYDFTRGEPRGKKGKVAGDCIDCGACVRVCPTGIDIRNGNQLECIGCARCIDACDLIMDKVKRPRHLIRYDSEARLNKKTTTLMRPRVLIYAVLLVVLVSGFFWAVSHRPLVEFNVLRSPGNPYIILQNGDVSNHLSLRLVNKDRQSHNISFRLEGLDEAQLVVPVQPFLLPANTIRRLEIFINVPVAALSDGKHPVVLKLYSDEMEVAQSDAYVLGPQQ